MRGGPDTLLLPDGSDVDEMEEGSIRFGHDRTYSSANLISISLLHMSIFTHVDQKLRFVRTWAHFWTSDRSIKFQDNLNSPHQFGQLVEQDFEPQNLLRTVPTQGLYSGSFFVSSDALA